jgi:hypothetical protein
MTLHAVVGALITFGPQQLEQAPRRQPLARRPLAVCLQHHVELSDESTEHGLRLNLAFVAKLGRRAADRLANRLPRDPQLAHDLADRLLLNQKRPPDPAHRFHCHHPRPRSPKHNQGGHSTIRGWVAIRRCSPPKPGHSSTLLSRPSLPRAIPEAIPAMRYPCRAATGQGGWCWRSAFWPEVTERAFLAHKWTDRERDGEISEEIRQK